MKVVQIIILLMVMSIAYATDENVEQTEDQSKFDKYSVELPQDLGRELEEFSLFQLGDLESMEFGIITHNDNFMHGIGAGFLGFKNADYVEGDDRGKTFTISLEALMEYENGEVALEFFSDLYSTLHVVENDDGTYGYRNNDGFMMTKNAAYEGVRVKLTRDLQSRYFVTFFVEAARIEDTQGIAGHIQTAFHRATESLGNKEYDFVEHSLGENIFTGGVGIGREFVLYNKGDFTLKNRTEVGVNYSNNDPFREAYIDSSLSVIYKRSEFKLYGSYDTNDHYRYGAEVDFTLYKSDRFEVSTSFGAYHENNQFNDLFPDDHHNPLLNTKYNHDQNDLMYEYRLQLKF